ncbi:enoyl-CoA hydratase/isomerase family protein [Pontibacillus litoralis]|uniref:Enoyl-CoA hydratase n=1 Tax=Pontibacillus litoralis JSM 072002 TaxID=1385512 RepID=A0A0A5GBI7_9BACI|nr:enoyl-CoA hydratase/isomerase family protein [Pontibacillus litoralis]KGX88553.1 hypothetical protein N784_07740 [Pontibacillus litoralis JSM 072002]
MFQTIKLHIHEEGYGELILSRPECRNAVSFQMIEELTEALKQAKEMDLRCLVVTGRGQKAFCAGGDLRDFRPDLSESEAFKALYQMKEVLYELARFPVPTIAMLNGHAVGGGSELATACDFRYGQQEASFGFIQSHLGIMPGWGGGALLYHRFPTLIAYQMLIEAKAYSASESLRLGWLQGVYEHTSYQEELEKILKPFLGKSVEQAREFKQQYIRYEFPVSLSVEMDEEVRRCSTLWGNDKHKQVVKAFLTKE